MVPLAESRLARVARERRALRPLVGAANGLVHRARRQLRREYRYWRKHELGWVVAVLVLSRRDAPRSRVLRAMAQPGVEKLRSRRSVPR